MSELRDYQRDAVEAAKEWLKTSTEPCLIEAPTGSGKSHIISALASWLHEISGGKRVLCLAPQKELCVQNHAKMIATGTPASIFSASAGVKSTRHKIVYATPKTVANSISRFTRTGNDGYCAIVLDEAHTIAPTVFGIIEAMTAVNPNLRVIGLSATPFKLGKGFIFRMHPDGRVNGDDVTRDPFFLKLVSSIDARALIDRGYLTPPKIGAINASSYDTSGLVLLPNGKFDSAAVDAAFVGHGRQTSQAVGDVVAQSRDRQGVVFFAATIRHAEEVLASLPKPLSAIITGETKNRDAILKRFERKELKYLVNVGVLTTGWDCPHVDVIALLRRTESVGLLQQMIGRGLRLSKGKKDCLILDFASNLDTHCPDGDLFAPIIKSKGSGGEGVMIDAECPDCGYVNEFSLNVEYADYQRDKHGYALDVFGNQLVTEHGPLSTHYGRRCLGVVPSAYERGRFDRCGYRWNGKECPECGEQNDIAARYCYACKAEIVDPNQKLVAEFRSMKRDPTRPQTDRVLSFDVREGMSRNGNETIRVDFVTPYRQFSIWMIRHPRNSKQEADLRRWRECGEAPETVSYMKEMDSGFFRVLAYNQPADDDGQPDFVLAETEKMRRMAA